MSEYIIIKGISMEFSSLNQPVNFYTKNMGNNINTIIETDNRPVSNNIFAQELSAQKPAAMNIPVKKRRKNKRLNTLDSEYLPDEVTEEPNDKPEDNDNFFLDKKENNFGENVKKAIEQFIITTPLINYHYMKQKKQTIQKAVEKLTDINQNVDELMNTAMPYGEETTIYKDIAANLTTAANLYGKTNKEI